MFMEKKPNKKGTEQYQLAKNPTEQDNQYHYYYTPGSSH